MKESYILGAPLAEDAIVAISYSEQIPVDTKNVRHNSRTETYDFESAITATGFGIFNIKLLIMTIPSAIASICATTTMAYMFSDAQCDLDLTLEDKGLLNAITYIGMISSAFLWGVVGDNYGRRVVLLYAYFLDFIICLISSLSTHKWMLMSAKFCSGFVMCGPIVVYMTYLSEFHRSSIRPRIITFAGIYYALGRLYLPLFAWLIMPLKLNTIIIDDLIVYTSWQVYLVICSLPSLISAIVHYNLPETPKFLMTKGRYVEALEIFRTIYTQNTGNPPETLPFSQLSDPIFDDKANNVCTKQSTFNAINYTLKQIKILFGPEYICKTILMCGLYFGSLLGGNTLRLWLPQLLTTMDEYSHTHNNTDATLCEMLDYSPKVLDISVGNQTITCTEPEVSEEVYINNTIIPVFTIVIFFIIGAIVRKVGKKTLLILQYVISGILVISNYWAKNSITAVILASLFLSFFSICATTKSSIAVELFPTNMRTTATSIFLLCGRIASVLGNILFPILLYTGCLPPFLLLGGFAFLCAILSSLLPTTENKALK